MSDSLRRLCQSLTQLLYVVSESLTQLLYMVRESLTQLLYAVSEVFFVVIPAYLTPDVVVIHSKYTTPYATDTDIYCE